MPVLICGSKTTIGKKKEKSRISTVQIDKLRDLLGIRRMDKVLNPRVRELCVVTKEVDEKIDEGEYNRNAKSVPVGEGLLKKKKKSFGCEASKENGAGEE